MRGRFSPGSASAGCTCCSATRWAGEVRWRASCARRRARRTAFLLEAAENTEEQRISSAERYAKVYNIDYKPLHLLRLLREACPTDAITHGMGRAGTFNVTGLVYRKEQLLAITPAHEGDNARFNASDAEKMRMIAR